MINYWLRVECQLLQIPSSNSTLAVANAVVQYLPGHFFSFLGVIINSTAVASGEGCNFSIQSCIEAFSVEYF